MEGGVADFFGGSGYIGCDVHVYSRFWLVIARIH